MSHGNPINTAVPPRLSVQTASPQAGPSSSAPSTGPAASGTGSLGRRPLGARRRGVAAGLYVANPDNSDDDGSPVRTSPVTASSTSSGGPRNLPPPNNSSQEDIPRGLPTIPQPQSTPPLLQPHSNSTPNLLSPTPPQPPPQPDRHLARRAFTSPVPPQDLHPQPSHRPMEVRHGSLGGGGGGSSGHPPSSPSRAARPALPSPPTQSSPPPQHGGLDGRRLPPNPRMSSPEEVLSPVGGEGGGRVRAGSFNAAPKRLLQVTTDNEQFTLVDITGMNTAEAIRDRIFSKVSPSLMLEARAVLPPASDKPSFDSGMTSIRTFRYSGPNTARTPIHTPCPTMSSARSATQKATIAPHSSSSSFKGYLPRPRLWYRLYKTATRVTSPRPSTACPTVIELEHAKAKRHLQLTLAQSALPASFEPHLRPRNPLFPTRGTAMAVLRHLVCQTHCRLKLDLVGEPRYSDWTLEEPKKTWMRPLAILSLRYSAKTKRSFCVRMPG